MAANAGGSPSSESEKSSLTVLTPRTVKQIDQKVAEAMQIGYASVKLVVKKGQLRFIEGPAPSEPVR